MNKQDFPVQDENRNLLHTHHSARKITREILINKINCANFKNQILTARFQHKFYDRTISVHVKPSPCFGDTLQLQWASASEFPEPVELFDFDTLFLTDNGDVLLITSGLYNIEEEGFSIPVPEKALTLSDRQYKRHDCRDISVLLMQDGSIFTGALQDFSPHSFRMDISAKPPVSFKWLNPDAPVTVTLRREQHVFYTGECRILRFDGGDSSRTIVASPTHTSIKRFKTKEYRSDRYHVHTPVHAHFTHPLTGKHCEFIVNDLSGSGFSLVEKKGKEVLMPGLIIPNINITLPGTMELSCTAQVIHRHQNEHPENEGISINGFAILDMDPQALTQLLAFIHQEDDSHSFIGSSIDLDELWNFFFESGFIYPEKYSHILDKKEEIKKTYEKLYCHNPKIGRYFINKENGVIRGHMAMVKAYENTWMIHHHAASPSGGRTAGIQVLNQVGSFTNSTHRIRSMHMDCLMCYFRPENKFPMKVFHGIASKIDEPKSCSTDPFAYFHLKSDPGNPAIGHDWSLTFSSSIDLLNFDSFYEKASGGLLTKAFGIKSGKPDYKMLMEEYRNAELTRDIEFYSLKKDKRLKAVIMSDRSSAGLNMSDLMNCVKVFVTDPEEITLDIIETAVGKVAGNYEDEDVPVLMFPLSFAESIALPYEKSYILWVLNMDESDQYFTHLRSMLKTTKH